MGALMDPGVHEELTGWAVDGLPNGVIQAEAMEGEAAPAAPAGPKGTSEPDGVGSR